MNLNSRNTCGNTPLHLAASEGHAQVTKCLLDSSADANVKNEQSFTPLELAVLNDHAKVASLLEPVATLTARSRQQLQMLKETKKGRTSWEPSTRNPNGAETDVSSEKGLFLGAKSESEDRVNEIASNAESAVDQVSNISNDEGSNISQEHNL